VDHDPSEAAADELVINLKTAKTLGLTDSARYWHEQMR
jgi:hypothetical protein